MLIDKLKFFGKQEVSTSCFLKSIDLAIVRYQGRNKAFEAVIQQENLHLVI
ncbi:MAG: hypothetical protein TRG1_717 [Flavobacteriaceae bacterium FS1-H7996/R]|nr:MAG: hypothetical protein TRG1_717 [Flavobacteriaceae bacterium FS1-H7996/R]